MAKHIIILIMALLGSALAARAGIDDLPVTTVNGRTYHYYDVEPKQTVYSICRELGITKAQLIKANPEVGTEGLKAFQRLLFPAAEKPVRAERATHLVKKSETIYGLCREYGLTPDQLVSWNPGIRDGLREGDIIYVSAPVATQPAGPALIIPATIQEPVESTPGPEL